MKIYRNVKFILFLAAGILVFVFDFFFLENIANLYNLVGSVMVFYGLEATVIMAVKKEIKEEKMLLTNQILTLLLGLILLFMPQTENNIIVLSVLWSVWAITRESEEINEKVLKNLDCKVTAVLNFAESVVVIVFSVLLILNPSEHHLHSHLLLLGAELILEVVLPVLTIGERAILQKRRCSVEIEIPEERRLPEETA